MNTNCARLSLALLVLSAASAHADEPTTNAGPEISLTPTVRYVTVSGDQQQFRADQWMDDGWVGGMDEATLHQVLGKDAYLDFTGRGLFEQDDYRLRLDITKTDLGFVRAGYTEYRKYFDGTGGFFEPFTPPAFTLDQGLHVDIGDVFVEVGLTLPNLPKLVLGYEYQFKKGDKSLLEWGSVVQGTETRKIFPSFMDVDESVDIVKAGLEHDIGKVHLDNQFRYEHYRNDNTRFDTSLNLNTGASKTVTIHEDYKQDAYFNTFRMDSHLNEKVYWSFGYMYNTLSGDNNLQVTTPPPLTPFDKNWMTQSVDVNLDSHILNLNTMFGPFAGLTINAGLQGGFTDSDGSTKALLMEGLLPATTNQIHSSNNQQSIEEILGLRYTKIPFTTLYAEGRWTEQSIDLHERETVDGSTTAPGAFKRVTDTDVTRQDYRVGFNTSPMRRLSLAGRYRRAMYDNAYDNEVDTVAGYPAFIRGQDFTTDEVMGRFTVRPHTRVSLAFTYQLIQTKIDTATDEVPSVVPKGSRQTGDYQSSVYSVSTTVTPLSRLYLTGLFSYQDTHTSTFDNNNPSVISYRGSVYTVVTTAGYALDNKTDLTAQYVYSRADNFKDNSADGLPLGLDNQRTAVLVGLQRKITDNIIARVRYGYYENNESSNGGVDNYTANLASASCTMRF